MTPAERLIREIIAEEGPIGVDRFMALALGHPQHGYYMTRDPFGERGDFVTAPEVSQMFGELIGLWCAAVWQQRNEPAPARLVELGPGRGTLMADALRAIGQSMPAFLDAASVHLVETSPVLRRRQERSLAGVPVEWHEDWDTIPAGASFIIANEFLDALPVAQFVWRGGKLAERLVALDGDALIFREAETRIDPPPHFPAGEDGMIQEWNRFAETAVAGMARLVRAEGGAVILIDYGYGKTQPGETLQAVRRHERHPVLEAPGEADLTAHVDFAAMKRAADAAGAQVYGPVFQGPFLRALGIDARRDALIRNAGPALIRDIMAAHKRLTAPEGMGELFKAMALVPRGAPTPPGFDIA